MKFALVTSEVNYVRKNNQDLLNSILKVYGEDLKALIVVKTLSPQLVTKALGLFAIGCRGIAKNLLTNSLRASLPNIFSEFKSRKVPIHYTQNINHEKSIEFIHSLDLDLLINIRTRNIFKKPILQIPRWGCINIHHGLLPHDRGTMCDLWAMATGRPFGYSIHWMNEKIDDGALIKVRKLENITEKNYAALPYLSSLEEARDLIDILKTLKENGGKIATTPNLSSNTQHTRNPTRRQLREMQKGGLRL